MGISLVRISDSQLWLQVRSIWSSFKITLMIKGPLQTNYARITSGGAQELLVLQISSVYSNKYPPLGTTEQSKRMRTVFPLDKGKIEQRDKSF